MEVKILEESKKSLKVEIGGEDHTLANALRRELWNDSHIKISGYNIDHPLAGSPVLTIETDASEEAKKALLAAVERLKKKNSKFLVKIESI